MRAHRSFRAAILSTGLIVGATACGPATEAPSEGAPGTAESRLAEVPAAAHVRAARDSFNRAIATRDLYVIDGLLMPTYHIVTGRSVQDAGHDSNVAMWEGLFASDPTMLYVRTTREVRVNEEFGLAEELGDWAGNYMSNGQPGEASGVYAAKWQRADDGRWLLQSEVFTTLECSGGPQACRPPDPIGN